jgi:L-rhamnose isomerase
MSELVDSVPNFQSSQIICLEFGSRYLYAEVIQVVAARQLCWTRPLMLVTLLSNVNLLFDLREGSDLILPLSLFRAAFDTEVIPFLTELQSIENKSQDGISAYRQLRKFLSEVCEAYPNVFEQFN